jgi:hypothetical protein
MKIGIYVHSLTGNTLSVAQRLAERFNEQGHEADIVRLEPVGGEKAGMTDLSKIKLETLPDPGAYDFIVFAGPVRGFSMSLVLGKCFSLLPRLDGKRVACLVTQQLSHPALGGNRAIGQMKTQCALKGARVCATAIVGWKPKVREPGIAQAVDAICGAI